MNLKKIPLYQKHIDCGAKIVDFYGWALPLEYGSQLAEAKSVRRSCGLFDASHMGQIRVAGRNAFSFLQKLVTGDLSLTEKGRLQYNLFLNAEAGVLDDLMVYNLGESFLCVVNASNIEKIFKWLQDNKEADVEIIDESPDTTLLSLQGPAAYLVMEGILKKKLDSFKYMGFIEENLEGRPVLISRSGYTAEDGFEIYTSSKNACFWWDLILKEGKDFGLQLCGLGARDILRVEAGYPLYGHEITEETNPFCASLSWAVKLNKDFVGKEALLKFKMDGIKRSRVGFLMLQRAVPRQGYEVYCNDGSDKEVIGGVSSGIYSPNLDKFIGMAYVEKSSACIDTLVELKIRDKFYKAKIVKFPFVEIKTYNRRCKMQNLECKLS